MVMRHRRIPSVIPSNGSIPDVDNNYEKHGDCFHAEELLEFVEEPKLLFNDLGVGDSPKIATKKEFMENIKKFSQDSRFSLDVNNSKSLIELHTNVNTIGNHLKRYIHYRPDSFFKYPLECNTIPLRLEPMKLDANNSDMPNSSYYELHPHPKFGPNYDDEYNMISVQMDRDEKNGHQDYYSRMKNLLDHQEYFGEDERRDYEGDERKWKCDPNGRYCGDGSKYCGKCCDINDYVEKHHLHRNIMENTPDESILAGLQTVANMIESKPTTKRPNSSFLRSRQNSPDRTFYNRNVITSSNTIDCLSKLCVSPPKHQSKSKTKKVDSFERLDKLDEVISYNSKKLSSELNTSISQQVLFDKFSSRLEDGPCNYIYGESSKSLVYYNKAVGSSGIKSAETIASSEASQSDNEVFNRKTSRVSFQSPSPTPSNNSTPTQASSKDNQPIAADKSTSVDKIESASGEGDPAKIEDRKAKTPPAVTPETSVGEIKGQEDEATKKSKCKNIKRKKSAIITAEKQTEVLCGDPRMIEPKYTASKASYFGKSGKGGKTSVLSVEKFKPIEIQTCPVATQHKAVTADKDKRTKKLKSGKGPFLSGVCTTETCENVPNEIRYAQTVISVFDRYTIYEVMKSTNVKPKNISKATEGVFVVKS